MTDYEILNHLPYTGANLIKLRQFAFDKFHEVNHPYEICKEAKSVLALEQALIYNGQLIDKYLVLYAAYVVEHHYTVSNEMVKSLIKQHEAVLEKYSKRFFKSRFKEYRYHRRQLAAHLESFNTLRNMRLDALSDRDIAHKQALKNDPLTRYKYWAELWSLNQSVITKLREQRDKLEAADPFSYTTIIGNALMGYND